MDAAVGVRGGEHVVDLGDGDDSRRRRDALCAQPVWITGAVDALMVCLECSGDVLEAGNGAEQLSADERVRADRGGVEGVRLRRTGDAPVDGQVKSDVVQESGGVRDLLLALTEPSRAGEHPCVVGYGRSVLRRAGIAQREQLPG